MKNDTIRINMLGDFSITCGDHVITDKDDRSRKVWTLLAYIIIFRDRDVTQEEMIDLLWRDYSSSDNPANALKTVLHRVRATLDRLEVVNGHQLVQRRTGGCAWNRELACVVDVDEFEDACKQGRCNKDVNIRLACFRRAVALYQGDFLPKLSADHWAASLSTYYRQLYISAVHDLLDILVQHAENEEIIALCTDAIRIEPYDESFYYHHIKALVDMGNQQAAMDQYEKMNELFFSKFGVNPSDELKSLYRQIVKTSREMEIDLNVIKEQLRETSQIMGAFLCEYEFFKDIYRVEARAAARNGSTIHLGLLTVTDTHGEQLSQRKLNLCMSKLIDMISASLRRGDVFAKYSVSQYILMLPCANYENSCLVLERIIKRFHRENPYSSAILRYSVQPLEPIF